MTKKALITALEKIRLESDTEGSPIDADLEADLLLLKFIDEQEIRAFIDDDKIRSAYDAIYRRYA